MDLTTAATVDLSGRWAGFYRYQSEQWGEFPITANLLQDGQRLFGERASLVLARRNTDALRAAKPA